MQQPSNTVATGDRKHDETKPASISVGLGPPATLRSAPSYYSVDTGNVSILGQQHWRKDRSFMAGGIVARAPPNAGLNQGLSLAVSGAGLASQRPSHGQWKEADDYERRPRA